ncbi:MAG: hypothetical protein DIZ80_09425 [endosymbiont of Galathealinum brachiosum]|uniref:Uncharacterized protein n=1 Tax=endosymbiont of Galathealinum brachiosum TaxID=2200906 RepID=A0A370DEA3_9GAMM|nr:MAG: hypothetical protein DIZ80_09425 [endosymbiont of Galathealinum brachiosum]
MSKHPIEKCMSAYMGMRLLSIFGNRVGCHPVLTTYDDKPVVINVNTVTSNPDFNKEVKYLIISSPLFIECANKEFKANVLKYCFDDIYIKNINKHKPKELKIFK